jgi:hypothetical protein
VGGGLTRKINIMVNLLKVTGITVYSTSDKFYKILMLLSGRPFVSDGMDLPHVVRPYASRLTPCAPWASHGRSGPGSRRAPLHLAIRAVALEPPHVMCAPCLAPRAMHLARASPRAARTSHYAPRATSTSLHWVATSR